MKKSSKFSSEVRARAVRLAQEQRGEDNALAEVINALYKAEL